MLCLPLPGSSMFKKHKLHATAIGNLGTDSRKALERLVCLETTVCA